MELHDFRGSLLFPPGSDESVAVQPLSEETVRDLGLAEISRRISREGTSPSKVLEILSAPSVDAQVIRYRQAVLSDLYRSQPLYEAFASIVPKIEEIALFADTRKDSRSPLQEAIWRLGELELYVSCIETLAEGFNREGQQISSQGLKLLAEYLDATTVSAQFQSLQQELPKLRAGLRRKQSVTLGINLDERLRPVEATLLSVNEYRFQEQALLPRILGMGGDDESLTSTTLHTSPVPETYARQAHRKFPLAPLFQDLEQLLGSTIRPMVRVLNRYITVNTLVLRRLQSDAAFYLGAVDLYRELAEASLPVSRPEIGPAEERVLRAKGFYNLLLAMRLLSGDRAAGGTAGNGQSPESDERGVRERIVLNDAVFDEDSRLHILTGPNQGGKTTFTQGIGLLHVLVQCGLFAPAEEAYLTPADTVVTHFPAEEKGQLSTGRLGEEAERFAGIFERVTGRSVVLLNESLASTSPGEGEYLAEDIVRALCVLGARGIFATHLHGLAERVEELNAITEGPSRLGSLVAGVEEHDESDTAIRTFHIRKGAPAGKSFAKDIASQYGISFEQLTERLRRRNLL
ncbi:MutS-related protein [Salinispira pacifica]